MSNHHESNSNLGRISRANRHALTTRNTNLLSEWINNEVFADQALFAIYLSIIPFDNNRIVSTCNFRNSYRLKSVLYILAHIQTKNMSTKCIEVNSGHRTAHVRYTFFWMSFFLWFSIRKQNEYFVYLQICQNLRIPHFDWNRIPKRVFTSCFFNLTSC